MSEQIVGVALFYRDTKEFISSVLKPARHGDLLNHLDRRLVPLIPEIICDGFVTSTNRLIDRAEAKELAISNGQYKPFSEAHKNMKYCFSEDLW